MQTLEEMTKQQKWGARWWHWNDEDGKKDYTSVIPQTLQEEQRWYDRMNEWHMIFNVWGSWRSQVHQNKEDIEEDVGTANNMQNEKEKKMRLMWMKHVIWRRRSSKYEWNTGTAQKVKTPKTTSLSEWRSGWLEHERRLIKMGMKWNMGKMIMKEEMETSNVIMCHLRQSPWWRNKGKTQKKMVLPHIYSIHTKCVTIILEDIQLLHSICSEKAVRKNKEQYLWCRAEMENGTT